MTHQLPREECCKNCFAQMDHTDPMHLLFSFRDIRRLGVPVSPKADYRGQYPGYLLLLWLTLHFSEPWNLAIKFSYISFSSRENFLSFITLALSPVGLPSAAYMVRKLAFPTHRASILQSNGERRQKSFAGGCLPKYDHIIRRNVGS